LDAELISFTLGGVLYQNTHPNVDGTPPGNVRIKI
jgi:hypothetical protein